MSTQWDNTNKHIFAGGGHLNRLATRLSYLNKQTRSGLRTAEGKWKAYTYAVGIFVLSFVVTFLVASVLTPTNNTNADDNTSSSASADGYTMTLSATSAVNLALSVSDDDTMTVGQGTVSVQTTSPGYRLYISMTGDTTGLSGIADGISGNIPATSGSLTSPISLTRGTWGYAIPSSGVAHLVTPNGFSSTYEEMSSTTPDTSKLFAVPPTSSSNPQMIASSTSSTSGDNYPIYYAVRANSATAPGSYTNNVLFTATADAGASRALTLTPSTIDANTATNITVATTLYSTADYLDATVTLGNTALTCSRTSNAPLSFSCPIPATTEGTYTVTVSIPKYSETYTSTLTVEDPTSYMQDFTIAECTAMDTGDAITLRDSRDDNDYVIKKLADGNCWMTENLRLVGDGQTALTPADSDVSDSTFVLTASDDSTWCTSTDATCLDKSMVLDSGNSTYGTYYNWYAATAGTGTQSMYSGNATSSICPKGWRLPTGGSSSEFQTLYDNYKSPALMQGDPAFVLSGSRKGGSTDSQGSSGNYWSSTAYYGYADNLSMNSSNVYPARNYGGKYQGFTVRCVSDTYNTLHIDPNSGNWNGSVDVQKFSQPQGETKTIVDPITPSVTFNDNSQGATYTATSPMFTGWTLSGDGDGSFSGNTYTFGSINTTNTLTANYSIDLPTITKSGYTCRWSLGADGVGHYYDSGATGVAISGDTTFYAICGSEFTITNMQQMTSSICSRTIVGASATLTDTRDSNKYTIKKLADGKCWMTQNLRLTGSRTLTPANSNVSSNWTLPAANSSFGTSCANTAKNMKSSTDATTYASYGNYYNWYAATAGTGKCTMSSGDATASICPRGWRLPTSGSSGEFSNLYKQYNSAAAMLDATNGPGFVLPGYRNDSSTVGQGSSASYWSRTANNLVEGAAYYLSLTSSSVGSARDGVTHYGRSVRCVAQ